MIKRYQGKVCLVSGASSGIGAAFARQLAAAGAQVALFARRQDKLGAVAQQIGGDPLCILGDVTSVADRFRLMEAVLERWGRVEVLINCVGRMNSQPLGAEDFSAVSAGEIEAMIAVNLLGMLHMTHNVLPGMKLRGEGLIINVSSSAGDLGIPQIALYSAAKAAVSAFSLTLYREMKPHGLHVLTVFPGYTASEMVYTPAQERKLAGMTPHPPAAVAEKALQAALQGQQKVLLDRRIGLLIGLNRWFPRLMDRLLPKMM